MGIEGSFSYLSFSDTLFCITHLPRWWNWYTRTTQNRMPQGLRVRLPLEAQIERSESCTERYSFSLEKRRTESKRLPASL